jgi:Domain of unknown function (DUF1707)
VVDRFGQPVGEVHQALLLGITCSDVLRPLADGRKNYGLPEARHDRTDPTEADRDEVIDSLKRAFVRDELTTDELSDRVATAHLAQTLDQLDGALADLSLDQD